MTDTTAAARPAAAEPAVRCPDCLALAAYQRTPKPVRCQEHAEEPES